MVEVQCRHQIVNSLDQTILNQTRHVITLIDFLGCNDRTSVFGDYELIQMLEKIKYAP